MDLLIQRILDGLGSGAIYSAMALAVVLIFVTTGTVNLAQGTMGMFCAFVAVDLSKDNGPNLPLVVALLMAVGVGAVGGALIERLIIRPVERESSHLPVIIVTLGLSLGIGALAGHFFTLNTVGLGSPFPDGSLHVGSVHIDYATLGLVGTILVVSGLMWFLFQRTRLGLAMRASVDNPESASLLGIDRGRMLMLGWGLAGGLGALAAVLIAPTTGVSTTMLDNALFYGFAAAALGGMDSPPGAIAGGFIVGLVQSLAPAYVPFIGNQLALLTAFVVMLAVLLLKPVGIFGRAQAHRL